MSPPRSGLNIFKSENIDLPGSIRATAQELLEEESVLGSVVFDRLHSPPEEMSPPEAFEKIKYLKNQKHLPFRSRIEFSTTSSMFDEIFSH